MWIILSIVAMLIAALFLYSSGKSEEERFVTVFTTGDPGLIAFAKSLLNDADIPYVVKGEGVQDLFGMGRMGTGYNFITGPVRLQVHSNYEREARELLSEIESPPPEEDDGAA
jgi:putative signal transducing protein